jgi:hypothetical protein
MEKPESEKNMRIVPPCCAPKPQAIYLGLPPKWFLGKYVKLGFPTKEGRKEHCWVLVDGLADEEDQELVGVLNNDPIIATDWNCGDRLSFHRNEIEDVLDS